MDKVYADEPIAIPADKGGPRFTPWMNDYSYLKDERNHTGTWQEKFNYIPLGDNPDNYLTVGGEIRYYAQDWEHVTLGVKNNDHNDSIEQRLRLFSDFHVGPNFRFFLEMSDNWEFGAEFPTPTNYSAVDFSQVFLDYRLNFNKDFNVTIRPGRFNMPLGSGIVVGTRDGANVWYTYDGVQTLWNLGQNTKLNIFDVKPVTVEKGSFENKPDNSREFSGAYLTQNLPNKDKLDIYYYDVKHNNNIKYPNLVGHQDRESVGLRYYGKNKQFDYDVEGIYQFGTMANADIEAYAGISNLGYTFDTPILAKPIKTRLGLRSSIFSGDNNTHDNTLKTFEPPFPRTAYYSYSGLFTLMNIVQVEPSLTFTVNPKFNFKVAYELLRKAESEDSIYYGGTGRPLIVASSEKKDLAKVAEIQIHYISTRNLYFNLTYALIKVEDALKAVGGADTNYVGLWGQFKF